MKHLSEETIELYVLHAREVDGQRRGIRIHLRSCPGCRALAEDIAQYYRESESELVAHESLIGTKPFVLRLPENQSYRRGPSTQGYPISKGYTYCPALWVCQTATVPCRYCRSWGDACGSCASFSANDASGQGADA